MPLLPTSKPLQTASAVALLWLATAVSSDAATLRFEFSTTPFTLANGACEAEYEFAWQGPQHCGDRIEGSIEIWQAEMDVEASWISRQYAIGFDDSIDGDYWFELGYDSCAGEWRSPVYSGNEGCLVWDFVWKNVSGEIVTTVYDGWRESVSQAYLSFETDAVGDIFGVVFGVSNDRPDFYVSQDGLTFAKYNDEEDFQYEASISWTLPIKPIFFPGGGGGGSDIPPVPLPAAGWLGLFGLAALAALRRRAAAAA